MFRARLEFAFLAPQARRRRPSRDPEGPGARLIGRPAPLGPFLAAGVILAAAGYSASMQPVLAVMRQAGASYGEARLAVALASETNARGEVVPAEALDKAEAVKAAAEADGREALFVRSVQMVEAGPRTVAQVSPAAEGITLQYTVSGTDGYYKSGTQQTDARGQVDFSIPAGDSGVEDTISVSAVLSGRSARTRYIWNGGAAPNNGSEP